MKKMAEYRNKFITFPTHLTFEVMAKEFMTMASDRYPSAAKILQTINKMGLNDINVKIIVLQQMRDAVREVGSLLYKSIEHRNELHAAIIEALEELEDELEELKESELEEDEEDEE